MMGDLFLKVLNQSITAAICAAVVILLRFVLKKCGAPKWINGILWALVGIRLLLPFFLTSVLSLQPSAQPLADDSFSQRIVLEEGAIKTYPAKPPAEKVDRAAQADPQIAPREEAAQSAPETAPPSEITVPEHQSASAAEAVPAASASQGLALSELLAAVWLCGVFAMLLFALIAYLRLLKKVAASIRLGGRVYVCDEIASPFILGVFRPRVFLPSGLRGAALESVMAHENAHLMRRDHLVKPLAFLLLAVHWFNPVILISYILLCRDIELACDEKVIRAMQPAEKAAYSETLLAVGMKKRLVTVCPLAFGEVGVKERVKSVLNYKKPAFWVIVVAILACAVFAVCFLTNPAVDSRSAKNLPDGMLEAIELSINEHNGGDYAPFETCALEILGSEKEGEGRKVYLWAYHATYSCENETLVMGSASSYPAAVTLVKNDSGADGLLWRVTNYEAPRDGGYYSDDIRAIFPKSLWDEVFDGQKYAEALREKCDANAVQYFGENPAPNAEVTSLRSLDATVFYEKYFHPMPGAEINGGTYENIRSLPVKRISSKEELDAYFAAMHEDELMKLQPHELYFEHPDSVLTEYGEGFFKENELFIVGIESPSSDRRYRLSEVINNYQNFSLLFTEEAYTQGEENDFRFYLYFIGVKKGEVTQEKLFAAQLATRENPGAPNAATAKTAAPVMPDPNSRKIKLVCPVTPVAADSFEGRVTELAADMRKNWGRDATYNGAGPGYRQVHFASAKDAFAYLGLSDLVVSSYPYETGLTTLSVHGNKEGAIESVTVTTTENVASAPERGIRVTIRCDVITDASSNAQWECVFDEDSDLYNISMLNTASGAPYLLVNPMYVDTPEYGTSYAFLSVNEAVYWITVLYEGEENHTQAIEYLKSCVNELSTGYAWNNQTYKAARPEDISSAVTSIRTLDATAFYDYYSQMQGDNVQPYSSVPYVPVKRITSQEELEAFFAPVFEDERMLNWQFGSIQFENPRAMLLSFDGWFFRESELFVIAIANSDKRPRYAVKSITANENQFSAEIYEEAYPYMDEARHRDCRLYFIGVRKGEIAENAALFARLERYMAPIPTRSAAAQKINPLIVSKNADGSYTLGAETDLIAPQELRGRVNELSEVIRKQYEHPRSSTSDSTLPWDTGMTFENLEDACEYVGYSGLIVPEIPDFNTHTNLTIAAQEDGTIAFVDISSTEIAVNNPQDIYVQSGIYIRTTACTESPFTKYTAGYLGFDEAPREAYTAEGVKFYYGTSVSEKGWKRYSAMLAINDVVYTVHVRYYEDAFAPLALDQVYFWADRLTYSYEGGLIPWEESPQAQAIVTMESNLWGEQVYPLLPIPEPDSLPFKRFSSASELDEFMEDAMGQWWYSNGVRKRLSAGGALSDAFFEAYDLWIVGFEAPNAERRFRFLGLDTEGGENAAVFEELRYSLESPEKEYSVDYFCFLAVHRPAGVQDAVTVVQPVEIFLGEN